MRSLKSQWNHWNMKSQWNHLNLKYRWNHLNLIPQWELEITLIWYHSEIAEIAVKSLKFEITTSATKSPRLYDWWQNHRALLKSRDLLRLRLFMSICVTSSWWSPSALIRFVNEVLTRAGFGLDSHSQAFDSISIILDTYQVQHIFSRTQSDDFECDIGLHTRYIDVFVRLKHWAITWDRIRIALALTVFPLCHVIRLSSQIRAGGRLRGSVCVRADEEISGVCGWRKRSVFIQRKYSGTRVRWWGRLCSPQEPSLEDHVLLRKRRMTQVEKNTCQLFIQTDHLFYKYYKSREAVIAQGACWPARALDQWCWCWCWCWWCSVFPCRSPVTSRPSMPSIRARTSWASATSASWSRGYGWLHL